MRELVFGVAFALLVGGCASSSSYSTPTTTAPAVWYTDVGENPDLTTYRQAEGPQGIDATLVTVDSFHPVRGRLLDDAVWGGGDKKLPAGTILYARNLSIERRVVRSYTGEILNRRNLNEKNNPVEWCAEHAKYETVCIFYQNPEEAFYLNAIGGAREALIANHHGARGNLPDIEVLEPEEGYLGSYTAVFARATRDTAFVQLRKIRSDGYAEHRGLLEVAFPDGAKRGTLLGLTPAILEATRDSNGVISALEIVYPESAEAFRNNPDEHWKAVMVEANPALRDDFDDDEFGDDTDQVVKTSY